MNQPTDLDKKLAKSVTRLRKEFGLSQAELAKRAKVSLRTLQFVEAVKRNNLTWSGLLRLARVFDCRLKITFKPLEKQR